MEPKPTYLRPAFGSGRPGHVTTSLCGVLASLLLHALLLGPVLMGGSAPKHRLPAALSSGSSASENEQSAMTLVFIEQPGPETAHGGGSMDGLTSLAPPSVLLQPVAIADVPRPGNLRGLEEENDAENTSNGALEGDPGLSMMVGRYLGQIDARIERAWIRPRGPIASGLFECRVRIVQETGGGVKEIEIVRCNGDTAWQMSLVRAIQSASPLPAPPDPRVFSRTVTLDFHSEPFVPGTDPEGFEPGPRTAMK